jgi:AcrR family transcriptional regulator
MDEIGFEAFTFKKLALHIDSTEASIYRYFESKNQLLLFLYGWYWSWMHYRVETATEHAVGTEEKLITALKILINRSVPSENYPFINEAKLRNIIEYEGIKSILTKRIDEFNNAGAFENYKKLVSMLVDWVLDIEPGYLHPNMLITTIIEGAHIQHFFAEHLPRLTNAVDLQAERISTDPVEHFFLSMLRNTLNLKKD